MKEKKRLSRRLTTKQKVRRERRIAETKKKSRSLPGEKDPLSSSIRTEEEIEELRKIRSSAELRQKLHEAGRRTESAPAASTRKDPSRKYLGQVHKLISESDVLVEVIDARDPLGSRDAEVEQAVRDRGKKLILLLNKIDLVSRDNWTGWTKYLRETCPTIPFKASTQSSRPTQTDSESTPGAYGARDLLGLLKNYARGGLSVVVGVLGCPNVGKSSVINSMKRERSCPVQNTPGVTKSLRKVVLDRSILLIDSPGVLQRRRHPLSDALRASTREVDPLECVSFLFERVSPLSLALLYGIEEPRTQDEFLVSLAVKRGKVARGGVPDTRTASFMVLRDLQQGKIKFSTPVPSSSSPEELAVALGKKTRAHSGAPMEICEERAYEAYPN